jgi:hypothetical protein
LIAEENGVSPESNQDDSLYYFLNLSSEITVHSSQRTAATRCGGSGAHLPARHVRELKRQSRQPKIILLVAANERLKLNRRKDTAVSAARYHRHAGAITVDADQTSTYRLRLFPSAEICKRLRHRHAQL